MSLDCLRQTCLAPSLKLALRHQNKKLKEGRIGRNALQRVLSRLFLRVGCSLIYIAGFQSIQWLISCLFPGDAETIPRVSGNKDVSTGVKTAGQLRGRHIVVTRSLLPLAGGPSRMSLRLSAVKVGARSSWSRPVMMVIFVFNWGICQYCPLLTMNFNHMSCLSDQFVTDPAATVTRTTGHQMASLCRFVRLEEEAQPLSPLMSS